MSANEERIKNIYQRINAVMLEVESVQKENKKVNNQYTFVSHDAVAAALHRPMAKHGIVMIPTIAELVQDGNRTSVKMEISFVNADNGDDRINVVSYGYGIDPQDKGIGKAVSYAVKYALLKLFVLETGDDVERSNLDYKPEAKNTSADTIPISEEQLKELSNVSGQSTRMVLLAAGAFGINIKNVKDLPATHFEQVKQFCVQEMLKREAQKDGGTK